MSGDGQMPHRFPQSALGVGEELLAWECQACGVWIREHGPMDRSECSIDWRAQARRRPRDSS